MKENAVVLATVLGCPSTFAVLRQNYWVIQLYLIAIQCFIKT